MTLTDSRFGNTAFERSLPVFHISGMNFFRKNAVYFVDGLK